MSTSAKITPSYYGYVGSTNDALLIIQAVIQKQLDPIPRRPHERERPLLIKSGNVFVFLEEQSGIKRWTDGIAWSPSRILGRFLVYRELDKQSLNEKDDKKKKKRKTSFDQDPLDLKQLMPPAQQLLQSSEGYSDNDFNKQLVGSLLSSYVFKDQGLIKKTLSLSLPASSVLSSSLTSNNSSGSKDSKSDSSDNDKHTIHLISYYNADDVLNGKLQRPSVTDLKDLVIPNELWSAIKESSLGGKIPIEDEAFYFLDTNYQLQNMSSLLQQLVHHQGQQHGNSSQGLGQNAQGHPPPPPHHQHMLQPGFFSQQKYPAPGQQQMHILPIPLQQQHGEDQHHQNSMLPPPQAGQQTGAGGQQAQVGSSSNELNFINPFTGSNPNTGASAAGTTTGNTNNNYGFGMSAGSGIPYYNNNYMNPPPPQAQQQQQPPAQGTPQQQFSHNQYIDNNNSYNSAGASNSNYPQPNYPPFPQHFQQIYPQGQGGQAQHQHGSILNSSEYSIGGNSNGSISSIGSTVVEGGNGASGSISSISGAPPSSIAKKGRGSVVGQSNWFTTSSSNNPGAGGYVAPPPANVNLGQSMAGGDGLHHHTNHHHNDEANNLTYVTSSNYSGTT